MRIIGIDPGKAGGIAWLDTEDGSAIISAGAAKMPETEDGISKLLATIKTQFPSPSPDVLAYLEHVHAMPATKEIKDRQAAPNLCRQILGRFDNRVVMQLEAAGVGTTIKTMQGSVGTFTFGQGYGFLRGCLVTLGIKFEDVRPQDWQAVNGCRTRGDKNISKARAVELFPSLKVTHYVADALLIARFGLKIYRSDQMQRRLIA